MASTYSDLKIELIGTGEQVGTWGSTTNTNLGTAIEEAIVGSANVAFSSADVTLTLTNTNGTQAARHLRLNLTGTSGGARNLILGSGCQIDKPYIINNGLADTVTVKNTTGTGVAVPAGKTTWVFNNGTNVVEAMNHAETFTAGTLTAGTLALTTPLAAASGGTGLTSPGTSGNILTSNGTAWTSAAAPPSTSFSAGTTGFTPNTFTSGNVTLAGTLNIANGGTGATTAQAARNNIAGAVTSGQYLRGNGSNVLMSAIQAGDVPTLNQNTTGSAATLTTARSIQTNLASTSAASFNGSANITPGVTGTLPVGNGGTGATSFTAGNYLKGNGSSAIQVQSGIPGSDITSGNIAAARITNALNASGSAPIYAARAWVNFNGTGVVAIRASGNVSSITDNSAGKYTVNFTTAMPNANYTVAGLTVCGTVNNISNGTLVLVGESSTGPSIKTTTAVQVGTGNDNTGGFADNADISIVVLL
jgi:hypothetical protein